MWYDNKGDFMDKNRELAIKYIKEKIEKKTFLTYPEIAEITGFHPKYILRLKKQLLDGTLQLVHGNKNRKPINALSDEEIRQIVTLYKRSNASVRKFCKFYNKRSYSCIYNLLKENNLIKSHK